MTYGFWVNGPKTRTHPRSWSARGCVRLLGSSFHDTDERTDEAGRQDDALVDDMKKQCSDVKSLLSEDLCCMKKHCKTRCNDALNQNKLLNYLINGGGGVTLKAHITDPVSRSVTDKLKDTSLCVISHKSLFITNKV